mmetsp:Transcript_1393/g.2226  ORF Transcript_1393/g.2226 Transcript_1393/m.2226 type:complete len:400 (+) Transcript_1393:97-1296(+)
MGKKNKSKRKNNNKPKMAEADAAPVPATSASLTETVLEDAPPAPVPSFFVDDDQKIPDVPSPPPPTTTDGGVGVVETTTEVAEEKLTDVPIPSEAKPPLANKKTQETTSVRPEIEDIDGMDKENNGSAFGRVAEKQPGKTVTSSVDTAVRVAPTESTSVAQNKNNDAVEAVDEIPGAISTPVSAIKQEVEHSISESLSQTKDEEDTSATVLSNAAPYDEVSATTPEKTKETSPSTFADDKETLEQKKDSKEKANEEPDVAIHLYEGVKGAWAWGKTHVPLAPLWMGMTESVANAVVQAVVGDDLNEVDKKIIQPHLAGFDSGVLNPAIHATVDAIMEGEEKQVTPSAGATSHEDGAEAPHHQNLLQQLLFPLLRPPLRFLINSNVKAKDPQEQHDVAAA